ncbi:SWIM zinc finger family protein [[Clostridium] innocuum]
MKQSCSCKAFSYLQILCK